MYSRPPPHSLGGPASFHPSVLPTLVKKASVPSPRQAVVPVAALWAGDKRTDEILHTVSNN